MAELFTKVLCHVCRVPACNGFHIVEIPPRHAGTMHTLAAIQRWSNDNADPIEDIERAIEVIRKAPRPGPSYLPAYTLRRHRVLARSINRAHLWHACLSLRTKEGMGELVLRPPRRGG